MTSAFLTLRKGHGQTTRSSVTDVEVSAFSECFLFVKFFNVYDSRVVEASDLGAEDPRFEPGQRHLV